VGVVQRNVLEGKVLLALVPRTMNSLAISRMVSVARPRKSNLTRPMASTSSLSYWLTAESLPGCWYSGQKSVSLPGAISTPPGVHADVARHAFELLRHLDDGAHVLFLATRSPAGAPAPARSCLVAVLLGLGRVGQGVGLPGLAGTSLEMPSQKV
jgi:hypothetical protein